MATYTVEQIEYLRAKAYVSYEEALRMAEKMDVRLIPYELEKGMEERKE